MRFTVIAMVAAVALMLAPPARAQQSFHSVAERRGATSASVSSGSAGDSDPALQAFKNMSPEERSATVQQAMEAFKTMSPEEREALTEQAKGMGGNMDAYGAEWAKLISPEQQKMVNEELKGYVKDAPADTAKTAASPAPAADNMATLMQKIRSLPPAQQQALMNSLRQSGVGAPASASNAPPAPAAASAPPADPCAEYQSVNPAFYANCEKRMNPGGKK